MTRTSRTLGAVLASRAAAVVGRRTERAVLLDLVERDRPLAVAVHGIAGVGKSALLAAFTSDARARGAAVVALDCRAVEPTERGFLAVLSQVTGRPAGSVRQAAAGLAGLGDRVVLTLDTYELLRLLDTWLRREFVPALHDNTRVVLAGREPPVAAWLAEFGDLLHAMPLTNLANADAVALLEREGLSQADASRINRFAHGHPLALRLAASARVATPALTVPEAATTVVVAELARLHLAGLDPTTRTVLDAACVVRRPTASLLAAMLPGMAPHDAHARMSPLPFVEPSPHGLALDDTVREAIAALLRANDPDAYRGYRVAAWRQLRRELRAAAPTDLWRYTADLLFLIENPSVREAFFPTTDYRYAVEPAQPADWPQIEAISRRHEPEAATGLLRAWWEAMPSAFTVARDRDGEVAALSCLCEATTLPVRLLAADPVATAWRTHLRADPVPGGQRVLFHRLLLTADGGEAVTAARASLIIDLKRTYLEMRPHLRRIYSPARDAAAVLPSLTPLGFTLLPDAATDVGGITYHTLRNDFGPSSIDGWLTDLAAREMLIHHDALLDPGRRQLCLAGDRVDLTRLEFDVLKYLHEREGRITSRASLLRDVWGYDWTGGSNVVEVVISSLRRKLGAHAGHLQTVRGAGYRFTPPAGLTD